MEKYCKLETDLDEVNVEVTQEVVDKIKEECRNGKLKRTEIVKNKLKMVIMYEFPNVITFEIGNPNYFEHIEKIIEEGDWDIDKILEIAGKIPVRTNEEKVNAVIKKNHSFDNKNFINNLKLSNKLDDLLIEIQNRHMISRKKLYGDIQAYILLDLYDHDLVLKMLTNKNKMGIFIEYEENGDNGWLLNDKDLETLFEIYNKINYN